MVAYQFAGVDVARWQTWVVPVVGLVSAGMVLVVSRYLAKSGSSKATEQTVTALDPFAQGSPSERRVSIRRNGRPMRVMLKDAKVETKEFEGWVVDRSMGGLCLSVDRELSANGLFTVRAAEANETVPWVQVRVKRCKPDGKSFQVGCQFVRIPSWGVLLQFG